MGELKSCPFCGSDASDTGHQQWSHPVQNTTWDDGAPIDESFSVNCLRCGISTLGSWGVGHRTKEIAIAKWNARALTPAQQAAEEMVEAAQALADSMETCHECNGTVFVQEQPVHCEDCSGDCDIHEGSECATISSLHLALKRKLAALAKAGKP